MIRQPPEQITNDKLGNNRCSLTDKELRIATLPSRSGPICHLSFVIHPAHCFFATESYLINTTRRYELIFPNNGWHRNQGTDRRKFL
jgi:hypothetical protein